MAKRINALDGITLRDLISEDGFVLDMSEEMEECTEEKSFNTNLNMTNEEMIRLLNMEEFAEEDGEENGDSGESMMPWCLSFEKIKEKCVDLTENGKVKKLTRRRGVGDPPAKDSLLMVHYSAYLEYQDEPFDSTFARGSPGKYRLGQGEILWGLEVALESMTKHEIAIFVIHHDYAYGELGCVDVVPPRSEVLFILQVMDIIEGSSYQTFDNLSAEEKRLFGNIKPRVDVLVKTAAESFKRNSIRQAMREYRRAAAILEFGHLENEEEERELNRLLSRIYSNLAVCYNKEDKPRQACSACLRVPTPSAKTHFHHGRALLKMGEYKQAIEELQISLKMSPGNKETIREIQLANDLQRKYLEAEKRLWNNCLKLRNNEQEINEYARVAKEFCRHFLNNEAILRQPFPEGLTLSEDKCMRQQAAALGLTVVEQIRYGKEIAYLAKSSYIKPN